MIGAAQSPLHFLKLVRVVRDGVYKADRGSCTRFGQSWLISGPIALLCGIFGPENQVVQDQKTSCVCSSSFLPKTHHGFGVAEVCAASLQQCRRLGCSHEPTAPTLCCSCQAVPVPAVGLSSSRCSQSNHKHSRYILLVSASVSYPKMFPLCRE